MRRALARDERGFAIVGVVMLVLALTILGLSLFSLSSYESQFINRSLDGQRAFDAASRGIERAKFQILKSGLLENSNWGMPYDGVDSVRAWQVVSGTTYTSGTVNAGVPVNLRAYGRVRTAVTTVEGQFQPRQSSDYYRWLFATSGRITVSTGGPGFPPPRFQTVSMTGWAWQTTSPWNWIPNVLWTNPPDSLRQGGGVPVPPLGPYLVAHPVAGMPMVPRSVISGNPFYDLDVPGPDPGYFTSNFSSSGVPDFSLLEALGTVTIRVRGAAVWVLPSGVAFLSSVKIEPLAGGGTNNCLVIVAGQSSGVNYPPLGMWFEQGIESTIPVILVTSSMCQIHQVSNSSNLAVNYLSVYARDIDLEGPLVSSGAKLTLRHAKNHPNDAPGALLDWLVQKGALPNGSTGQPALTLIPGTWKLTSN